MSSVIWELRLIASSGELRSLAAVVETEPKSRCRYSTLPVQFAAEVPFDAGARRPADAGGEIDEWRDGGSAGAVEARDRAFIVEAAERDTAGDIGQGVRRHEGAEAAPHVANHSIFWLGSKFAVTAPAGLQMVPGQVNAGLPRWRVS